MAIASLVLGIVSIVFSAIPGLGLLSWILAIVGIILGALGRKNPEKKGIATAGLVCSIIGLILGIITWLACAAVLGVAGSSLAK